MKQHATRFLTLVNESKKRINELTPKMLKERMNHEKVSLIDVREESEWATGHIPSAIHLSKGIIERDIEKKIPELNTPIVVYCSGGFRCALVADSLQQMGYSQVYSLASGMQGWIDEGYEITK